MSVKEKRQELVSKLFPGGIPRLWCPLLTHYREDISIDIPRMKAHFNHIVPWVKGYLMPGSTGDGWELNREESMEVIEFALQMARENDAYVLLGALKSDVDTMQQTIDEMLQRLHELTEIKDIMNCLASAHVCGFTVTPPTGESLDQKIIHRALSQIIEKDLPIALYQLPQVTHNEMAPETFEQLVQNYSNVILFKDSSGYDRIALADIDPGDVYLVRGAEGDYAKWLKDAGGRYDGFLLSTANCFPSQIMAVIEHIENGDLKSARELSRRLTTVINNVFELVQSVPSGNAFTNANKAIDHYYAFGETAAERKGPMLHGGIHLSADVIIATGEILVKYDLMPENGYLE
jgi:dihydrodipicolinate synthase/N-acetylneuraminate lyase